MRLEYDADQPANRRWCAVTDVGVVPLPSGTLIPAEAEGASPLDAAVALVQALEDKLSELRHQAVGAPR